MRLSDLEGTGELILHKSESAALTDQDFASALRAKRELCCTASSGKEPVECNAGEVLQLLCCTKVSFGRVTQLGNVVSNVHVRM